MQLNILTCRQGSLAAWFQSVFGATTIFSFFQSAAMGGYGVAAVINAFWGLVGGVGAAAAWLGCAEMELDARLR